MRHRTMLVFIRLQTEMPTSKYLLGWIMVLFYFFYKLMFKLLSCCISGRKQTSVASRRRANMPASTQTAFSWAPLKSSVDRASSSKLTSGWTFIFLEWIWNIKVRAVSKCSVWKTSQQMKFKDTKPVEFELLLLHLGVETQFYDLIDQNA